MRTVTQTDRQLIFKHLSIHHLLGRSMIMGGLVVFGIFLFLITTSASLRCQRTINNKINCLLERITSIRKLEDIQVLDLSGAEVKEYPKGYPKYETIISTEQGTTSLLGHTGGDYRSNHLMVFRIRRFIASTDQKSFFIEADGSNFFLIERVGLLFLTGIGLLFSTFPIVTCVFDKNLNQLILIRKRFVLQEETKYSLNSVIDIKLEDSVERKDTLGLVDRLYRITIVLESSEQIPLFQDYSLLKTDARYFSEKISRYLSS